MKINDKSFAVMIGGHLFTGEDIMKMSVNGSGFEMVYGWCTDTDTEVTVRCKTKDVEFVDSGISPQSPKRVVYETVCENCLGERKVDVEIVTPLEEIKEALVDALKTIKEEQCNIEIKIDGKDFAKLIKKHNQDRIRSD